MSNENSHLKEFVNEIANAIKSGEKLENIIADLERLGIPSDQASVIVSKVSEAIIADHVEKENRAARFSSIIFFSRETLFLSLAAALVCGIAFVLSFVLGAISEIFELIGLGIIGQLIVKLGEMAAGAGLAAGASIVAQESQSVGVFIGGWIGAIVYYILLYQMLS